MGLGFKYLFSLILIFFSFSIFAQSVTMDPLIVTNSDCLSDGTISVRNVVVNTGGKILAKIYYRLEPIAPSTHTIAETENPSDIYNYTFSGIPSGTYKVYVRALFADNSSVSNLNPPNTIVGGSYTTPSSSAYVYVESLDGCDTTGVMYVRVVGGKKPMNVSINQYTGSGVSPVGRLATYSKTVNTTTHEYYFTSLPSGSYVFRITDNCNNTQHTGASLGTVNLNVLDWFSTINQNYFTKWADNCHLSIGRLFGDSNHPNKANLMNHYGKHPSIKLKIESNDLTYTSINDITALVPIPVEYTKDQEFLGKMQIINPCGQIIQTFDSPIRLSALNNRYFSNFNDGIVAFDNTGRTELGLEISTYRPYITNGNVIDWYLGQEYRIIFNGVISPWKTIALKGDGKLDTLRFSTGFVDFKTMFKTLTDPQLQGVLEIKTKCGGIARTPFVIYRPAIGITWSCGVYSTYLSRSYAVALPAKIIMKNTSTGLEYTLVIPKRDVTFSMPNVPAGNYEEVLLGADGYSSKSSKNIGLELKFESYNISSCEEKKANLKLYFIEQGFRVKLISSPVPYYFDQILTGYVWASIGPDNGKPGIVGDYKFEITDLCGKTTVVDAKQTLGYVVNSHSVVKGASDCSGMNFTVNADVRNWPNNPVKSYYTFVSAPSGFVKPPQNVPVGQITKLNLKGTYIVGLTVNTTNTSCNLRLDTITYTGSGVEFDMDRSFAYICQGDANSEGKINAKARYGVDPYQYYLSARGTGGLGVENRPHVTNNTGEFLTENLIRGQQYDITIMDNCNNIAVQTFTITNLTDYKLAYAEVDLVCVGHAIKFKSMGLPNPTFKWYYPNGTFFSSDANPTIINAKLSDKGIYKVEITSDLCGGAKTDVLFVNVNVIDSPTLSVLSGTLDQTICPGTTMQSTVIQWGGSAQDVIISGLKFAEYTRDDFNKTITVKSITSAKSYAITTTGSCEIVTLKGEITTQPQPTISGASFHHFCLNEAINFVYNIANTNSVSITGLPTGITAKVIATNIIFSGTLTSQGVHTVNIELTNTLPNHPCPVKNYSFVLNAGIGLTLTPTHVTCNSLGKITPNFAGGAAPFQYSLDNNNWGTMGILSNLKAGTYTVYVKDSKKCIASEVVTIDVLTGLPAGSISYADGPLSYGIAQHTIAKCIYWGSFDSNKLQTNALPSNQANTSLNDNAIVGLVNGQLPLTTDGYTNIDQINFKLDASGNLTLKVIATNQDQFTAHALAWIDFNKNGVFDTGEASKQLDIPPSTSNQVYNIVWANAGSMIQNGISYLRLRICSDVITANDAVKPFPDGKVEDYKLNFSAFSIDKVATVKNKGTANADMGDTILYTLTITNNLSQEITVDVFDPLAPSILYITNSASHAGFLSGNGKQVNWNQLQLPKGQTILTLEAKIISRPLTNFINNIAYVAKATDTINSGLNSILAKIQINSIKVLNDCALTWSNKTTLINVLKNDLHDKVNLPNITTAPLIGTANVLLDSTIQYIPTLNLNGLDSMTYRILDGIGTSVSAKAYIAVLKPLSNLFLICQNSTATIGVESNTNVQVLWYKQLTDPAPFAVGNTLSVDMKKKDTVFYIGVSIKGQCEPENRLILPVLLGKTPVYSDVRVQVCPSPARLINLSQYIDTVFIPNANWNLNWASGSNQPIVNVQHQVNSADFTSNSVYKFVYKSESNCGTSLANLYLTTGRTNLVPLTTKIVICNQFANAIHLKQLLGLDAAGTWTYANSLNPYIKETVTDPHRGALIFEGKQAYADGVGALITHLGDTQARLIEFIYTTPANACTGIKNYKIQIILTKELL